MDVMQTGYSVRRICSVWGEIPTEPLAGIVIKTAAGTRCSLLAVLYPERTRTQRRNRRMGALQNRKERMVSAVSGRVRRSRARRSVPAGAQSLAYREQERSRIPGAVPAIGENRAPRDQEGSRVLRAVPVIGEKQVPRG